MGRIRERLKGKKPQKGEMPQKSGKLQKCKRLQRYLRPGYFIIIALILYFHADFLSHTSILLNHNAFSYPSLLVLDGEGNRYILDKSTTRLLVLDSANRYLYQIDGGSTNEKGFNFANNIAVDEEGNVYLTSVESNRNDDMDHAYKLLKYDNKGKLVQVLYLKEYEEDQEPYIHSSCMTLEYMEGRLYYAQREYDRVAMYSIAADGSETEPKLELSGEYPQAELLAAAMAIHPGRKELYVTDKLGNIYYVGGELELLYDGGNYVPQESFYEIPYELAVSGDGATLYYADIGMREIIAFALESGERTVVYPRQDGPLDEAPLFYRLNYTEQPSASLSFCSSEFNTIYVFDMEQGNTMSTDHFTYPAGLRMKYLILMILMAGTALYLVKCLLQFLVTILLKHGSDMIQSCIMVFVSMALVFFITAGYIIADTTQRYTDSVLQSMYSMARLTASMVDGDLLEQLDSPDDYMNEDYRMVRQQLHMAYDKAYDEIYQFNDEMGNTTYCVFYRMQNHVVYYTMHLSDDSGVIYPDILTYEDSDYKYIKENDKAIIFAEVSTDDGEWMYASVPVYNSAGEMIAVCEVGRDRVSYLQANSQLMIALMIKIGSLAVVIFFVITELVNFVNILRKKLAVQEREHKANELLLVDFVRVFAFLIFMADNFTSVMIPILSERMYDASLPVPIEIATALPTSAQALAASVTGFVFRGVIIRLGNRRAFRLGILMHGAGLLLCGLSGSLIPFTLSMFVVGIGMGINVICLNTYVAAQASGDQVKGFAMITTGTFAGTNCGIIIGTMLSEEFDYSMVFFLSAVLAACLFLVVSFIYRQDITVEEESQEEARNKKISLGDFLWNPRIMGYFVFAMVPYLIFASFVYYFMPIFAAGNGITESNIGVITLIYGMATAYLAAVSEKLIKRFGSRKSILLASLLTVAALGIFIASPSIQSMLAVVLVMGIADSFGYTALSFHFAGMDEVQKYGEENAYGINSVFDGLANTVAPYIFAVAMMVGIRKGMLLIGAGFLLCMAGFAATSRRSRVKRSQTDSIS